MTIIRRETASGGSVAFADEAPASRCALCERPDPIGVRCVAVVAFEARTLTTALCGTCLAEALAILFGRQHVADGGSVDDLRYDQPWSCSRCGARDETFRYDGGDVCERCVSESFAESG